VAGDDAVEEVWAVEDIPDPDLLFLRVHRSNIGKDGQPNAGAIQPHEGSMSVDWNRYSTPEETRGRATQPPENYGVAEFQAGAARTAGLAVTHSPDRETNNRAHTDVTGDLKATEVRLKMRRALRWRIAPA
jgi:hypothetical protein